MKKKFLSPVLKVVLLATFALLCKQFCMKATDGFTIYRIAAPLPQFDLSLADATPEKTAELRSIADQRFFYLAKGAQCYAFVSEDGKYVIKFLKKKQFTQIPALRYLPFYADTYDQRATSQKAKMLEEFESYKIAEEDLLEETGLVYLHLKPTSHLQKKITLVDRLNIAHPIDLDTIEFIVQKRGDLIYPTLQTLRADNDLENAKKLVSDLCQLLHTRAQKQISDTDPNFSKNFACVGLTPIQIDIGRFAYVSSKEEQTQQYLFRMQNSFRPFLVENFSELVEHFDQEFSYLLQQGDF